MGVKRTRLRPVSKKRAKQLRVYTKIRREFLDSKMCEACKIRPASEVHHKKGRIGADLLDRDYFMAICRGCHSAIHLNPTWARAKDYLVRQGKPSKNLGSF